MKCSWIILAIFFLTGCNNHAYWEDDTSIPPVDAIKTALQKFRHHEKIQGLAFAVFDNTNIISQECLGNSTEGYKIDNKTIFSLQSVSKNVTALAVMMAVQDSLLDLDTPISKYLPDFKVNSCFDANPADKITLRMLLSHTAGFTHEAPAGNNYDYEPCTFEDHLKSISNTWLKFEPGTGYSYSNLGLDLAAKIVEQASGMKFNEYLKSHLFNPLGMKSSVSSDAEFLASQDKTDGTIRAVMTEHYCIPLMGSGSVYTSLEDFIKYLQFQMISGEANGAKLLDRKYLDEMYTIRLNNYGLGTYIDKSDGMYYINHNGSGYGYSATFLWYPEFNIGAVMLCNKQCNTFDFCETALKKLIHGNSLVKDTTVTSEFDRINGNYFTHSGEINCTKPQYCSNDTIYKADWERYTGKYALDFNGLNFKWYARLAFLFGFHPDKIEIVKEGQVLKLKDNSSVSTLREYKPGLFFTSDGEVVDFNLTTPTYKNIKLNKL